MWPVLVVEQPGVGWGEPGRCRARHQRHFRFAKVQWLWSNSLGAVRLNWEVEH